MVSWCFVCWSWGFVSYGFFFRVAWSSFIGNFNNISGVAIGSVVFNNLCTAIWKVDTIFSRGSVTITGFVCGEVDSGIIVSCRVSESVFWGYMFWFFVSRGMVDGSFVGWSVINWSFVGWGMVDGSFIGWGMINWSSMVNWGIKSSWVVDWSSLVSWGGMVSWSMRYFMAVSFGVAMFYRSMARDGRIGTGSSQEGNKSYE